MGASALKIISPGQRGDLHRRERFSHHQQSGPVECLLVSSSARTLNGGAFACKVPNHRVFYQTVNGETFRKTVRGKQVWVSIYIYIYVII